MLAILIDNIFAMFGERVFQFDVCVSRYEADLSVYMGSFISSSMG
jgi:hypothetical protein